MTSDSTSRKYRLRDGHALADEVRRAAAGRAGHALEQLGDELEREPGEAVHTARKDLKKLRSLLRLVRSELGDDLYERSNDELREAGRALGGMRDADVLIETLEDVLGDHEDLIEEGVAVGLRGDLLGQRARAASETAMRRAAADATARIESVADEIPDWPDVSTEAVAAGLVRAYRRGRKRWREAEDDPTAERLHELRKRAKDHWYHVRLVRDAWPEPLKARADEVHRLADLLGDDHDLAILAERAAEVITEPDDRADLLAAVEEPRRELQREAFSLAARVYAERPKAFDRRMSALLEAWQGAFAAA